MRGFRHFCRFISLALIVGLIHQSHREFLLELKEKGQPIGLEEVRQILPATSSSWPAPTPNPSFWRPTRKESLWEPSPKLHPLEIQPSDFPDPPISWSSGTRIKKFTRFQSDRVGTPLITSMRFLKSPPFSNNSWGRHEKNWLNPKPGSRFGSNLDQFGHHGRNLFAFRRRKKASRFPNPIQLHEITDYFPTASELIPSATHPSLLDVYDATKTKLGLIGRSSPMPIKSLATKVPSTAFW